MQTRLIRQALFPTLLLAALFAASGNAAVEPTGRISGRVGDFPSAANLAPIPVKEVELFTGGSPRPAATATPSESGEFRFDAVPKGRIELHPVLVDAMGNNASNPSALRAPGIARAGETLRVVLFGKGRPVTGTLRLPSHVAPETCRVELNYVAPPFRTHKDRSGQATPSWHAYALLTQRKLEAPVGPDGRFRLEGVRSGNYRLSVMRTVAGKPVSLIPDRAAEEDRLPDRVTIWLMSGEEGEKPQDLGTSAWTER